MVFGSVFGSPVGGLVVEKVWEYPGTLSGDLSASHPFAFAGSSATSATVHQGPIGSRIGSKLVHGVMVVTGQGTYPSPTYYSNEEHAKLTVKLTEGAAVNLHMDSQMIFDGLTDTLTDSFNAAWIWLPAAATGRRFATVLNSSAQLETVDINDAANVTVDAWLGETTSSGRFFTMGTEGSIAGGTMTITLEDCTNPGGGSNGTIIHPEIYIAYTLFPPDVKAVTTEDEHQADTVATQFLTQFGLPGSHPQGYLTNPHDTSLNITEV